MNKTINKKCNMLTKNIDKLELIRDDIKTLNTVFHKKYTEMEQ